MTEPQHASQRTLQLPPELMRQIGILNARITNANLANTDLLREVEITFKAMTIEMEKIQKENFDLRTKPEVTKESLQT
jgi:hypothetical protein